VFDRGLLIKKRLHYKSITVLSLYVAPPIGLEPCHFYKEKKINPDIKTTPIPILEKKYFLSYEKPPPIWWGLGN